MKTSILVAVVVAAALSVAGAYADDTHHSDKKGAPAKDAKAPMAKGMPMGMMQDKMLKMHEQMHKIMQAKDPKERDKLMQEHMQMMQEHMKMMGGGMGGMMGGDAKGGMMGR